MIWHTVFQWDSSGQAVGEFSVRRGGFAWDMTARSFHCSDLTILRYSDRTRRFADFRAEWIPRTQTVGSISLTVDAYHFVLGGTEDPAIKIFLNSAPVAVTGAARFQKGGLRHVTLERTRGNLSVSVDGKVVLSAPDPLPGESVGSCDLVFPPGASLENLAFAVGRRSPRATAPLPTTRKLHMCVDFFDDLISTTWTGQALERVMNAYRERGIQRLYFVYHYGVQGGFWDHSAIPGHDRHIQETIREIGDFLPAFTSAARNSGLETVAIFKPYETAFPYTYPRSSAEAEKHGKLERIDGRMWWCPNVVVRHPEWRLKRKAEKVPRDARISQVVFRAEKGTGSDFDPGRIRIWTSRENDGYREYCGPRRISHHGEIVTLAGLEFEDRFVAFTVEGEATPRFGNQLKHLATLCNEAGNPLPASMAVLTYPRRLPPPQAGFVFDYPQSTASAVCDDYFWLDGNRPLALTIGRELWHHGALCETEAAVQAWWMEQLRTCVEAGVDGVDLRLVDHQRAFDWFEFLYHPSLVEACRQKFGVDLSDSEPGREKIRRLRGERFSEFVGQASRYLKNAEKKLHVHVSSRMRDPAWYTEKEVDFDWRMWVRSGWIDEITLKDGNLRDGLADQVLQEAHRAGIPVNWCPYLNILARAEWGPQIFESQMVDAAMTPINGFIIYENAVMTSVTPDQRILWKHPWMMDALERWCRA